MKQAFPRGRSILADPQHRCSTVRYLEAKIMRIMAILFALSMILCHVASFSPVNNMVSRNHHHRSSTSSISIEHNHHQHQRRTNTLILLRMSDSPPSDGKGGMEKAKDKKKSLQTIVIDKTDTQMEEDETPEEMWRVVLHNDEVHTFNYVIRSLQKVMGTLDKKKAFDICTVTHGQGQATVTSCWKEQAMKYCLGLQRQGLTASIAPDSKFEGGGGGEPESG